MLCMALTAMFASCKDTESYSDLYNSEEKAVNWYLSQQRVCGSVPENGKFEIGPEAPFYQLDEDGFVYMQVISEGDTESRAGEGDIVYFRWTAQNIKDMYKGYDPVVEGNNAGDGTAPSNFMFGNDEIASTLDLGTGIQMPLYYLGYGCEVNLVIRSNKGFADTQSQCIPYIMNVQYYKPES